LTLIETHNYLITKGKHQIRLPNMEGYIVVKDNLNNLNIPPFRGGILR